MRARRCWNCGADTSVWTLRGSIFCSSSCSEAYRVWLDSWKRQRDQAQS